MSTFLFHQTRPRTAPVRSSKGLSTKGLSSSSSAASAPSRVRDSWSTGEAPVLRLVDFLKRLTTPEISGTNRGKSSHIIWNHLRPSKVYQHRTWNGTPTKDEFGRGCVSKIPCSKTPPQSWFTYLGRVWRHHHARFESQGAVLCWKSRFQPWPRILSHRK